MSEQQHFIIATAGHVDHGKSALVKALTGTDPDRLPEEKRRGITIDLGFAHLALASSDSGPSYQLGIVDVPGHEDFVKNMVAGVGAVDLALLVVAADDGWMPQTAEHVEILTYLGVRHGVVALTKIDLASNEAAAIAAVRQHLQGTSLVSSPIVPTSVISGRGLAEVKLALQRVLSDLRPSRDIGKPRLPVDRVFTLPGVGTVVTGTLFGGRLRRGDLTVIQPSGTRARIRRIQSHGEEVEESGPGTRTALNLADINANEDIQRGNVITVGGLGAPGETLDVRVEMSPRATRPLKDGVRVRVHHGSGHVPAHVALASGTELAGGACALAQLRLEAPAFVFAGDRLTIRDWPSQNTLAGALVLDPDANRKSFRNRERLAWLERIATSMEDPAQFVAAVIVRYGAVRRTQLAVKSRFSSSDVDAALDRLVRDGSVRSAQDLIVDAASWRSVRQRAVDLIDAVHRRHPEQLGMPLTDLRSALQELLPVGELFEPLVSDLGAGDFVRSGSVIRRVSHRASLPQPMQAMGTKLRDTLAANLFDPPSRKELAPDTVSQRALKFLVDSGEVVEINAELVMSALAVTQATARVQGFIRQHGSATVSELRQTLGSSRRVVVPLLEYLDRTFVTLRRGDKRTLR